MINQVFLMTYDQWQVWEGGLVKVTGLVGFVQEREQSSLVSVGFEPATSDSLTAQEIKLLYLDQNLPSNSFQGCDLRLVGISL